MHSKDPSRWSIPDCLYRNRHGASAWFVMTLVGLGLGATPIAFIVWKFDYDTMMMIVQSPIWTVILAIVASPLAYYVWLVRDRNALESRRQIKEAELMKNFHQLQEWIASDQNEAKRVSAILQLQDYVITPSYIFPAEMSHFSELQRQARDFLRFLIRNRSIFDGAFDPLKEDHDRAKDRPSSAATAMADTIKKASLLIGRIEGLQAQNLNLSDADFCGVKLMNPFFAFAHLNHAIFNQATFLGGDFRSTQMRGAEFQSAELHATTFAETVMSDSKFDSATLTNCSMESLRARTVAFTKTVMNGVTVEKCSFAGCNLVESDLRLAHITNTHFSSCTFRDATLEGASFHQCVFVGCDFTGTSFENAHFIDCRFRQCKIDKTDFSHASFITATFTDMDLSQATMDHVEYDTTTRFPDGTNLNKMVEVDWAVDP